MRSPEPNLNHQIELTRQLQSVRPELKTFTKGSFSEQHIPAYLDMISAQLKLPVLISSTGPTADDKHQVRSVKVSN